MNLPTSPTNSNSLSIIGESEAMQAVIRRVNQVAPTTATVLITGETGVGKDVIARTVHENSSRKNLSFHAVNCGVLYQDLLQSELFGHEKGAFTGATSQRRGVFELANGGTLFLDEIGEMPPEVQVKFLRVLETQEFTRLGGERNVKVDVRIIAATNIDLGRSVKENKFRQDLYYRLNLFQIHIPPLRNRREDIRLFVDAFISELNERHNKSIIGIKPEALNYLEKAEWPGNIRQLKNAVESAMIMTDTDELDIEDFPKELRLEQSQFPVPILDEPGTSIQVINPDSETVVAKNEAIYKTILALIAYVSRLLKSTTLPKAQVPFPIPDEENGWMHIADTDDAADIFRKAYDVLLASQEGLENLTQDEVTSIVTSVEQREGSQKQDEFFPILDEEKIIGRVGMSMEEIEKAAIYKTLRETGNNKTEAAKILGIGVRTIYRKLDEYEQENDEPNDPISQE